MQSVFNEEIFFLSHNEVKNPGVTVRVMDIYTFVNSKVSSGCIAEVIVTSSQGVSCLFGTEMSHSCKYTLMKWHCSDEKE